jgi:hypothetical protein
MKYAIILLLLAPFVCADVVIQQVLYDPVGTESGGEAVELKNSGNSSVDISGWILATESSDTDATIPENTILGAGEAFLVADEGWDDNKDDSSWRSADYEEKITLGNTDSGIALLANNSVVDAVGWGDEAEIENNLFEGSPALPASPGKSLVRTQDSDDNSDDFIESSADFQDGIAVPITADVTVTVPAIEVSKSLSLAPEGVLSIKNNGDSAVSVKLLFNDFLYKNHTIPKSAVSLDGPSEFTVEANSEHKSKVSLKIPSNVVQGKYISTLRVLIG